MMAPFPITRWVLTIIWKMLTGFARLPWWGMLAVGIALVVVGATIK